MKKTIELPDKLSYGRLMLLSFQIDPLYSFVNLLIQLIGTFLAPYGVILTAKFVDTAIGIFYGTNTAGEIVLLNQILQYHHRYDLRSCHAEKPYNKMEALGASFSEKSIFSGHEVS